MSAKPISLSEGGEPWHWSMQLVRIMSTIQYVPTREVCYNLKDDKFPEDLNYMAIVQKHLTERMLLQIVFACGIHAAKNSISDIVAEEVKSNA